MKRTVRSIFTQRVEAYVKIDCIEKKCSFIPKNILQTMARTCSHNSFHNSQYFLARRTAKTSMTTKAISYPSVALCKNKPRGQPQLVKLTIFMKLVLLAEPFHSFTLKERLDRNGILGIFNERICLSR